MPTIVVRHFAAARAAAAGVEEEKLLLDEEATVADALDALRERHGAGYATILQRCSLLLDEMAVRDHGRTLDDGSVLDVLPPFAGG